MQENVDIAPQSHVNDAEEIVGQAPVVLKSEVDAPNENILDQIQNVERGEEFQAATTPVTVSRPG